MKAVLSITTKVYTDDDNDSVEIVTDGEYGYANGVIYLVYDESELTGMQGTRTYFEIQDNCVNLIRTGTVGSRVKFQTGEKHFFAYSTPEGVITMGVETSSVVNRLGVSGGELELHYSIDVQGAPISRNDVLIKVSVV